MGFTPLAGIIMGTRSGSIDPAIIFHLEKKLKIDKEKIYKILNNESGLKGISQKSSDMRILYKNSLEKDKQSILAMEIFSYQIAKYIGAYTAALNGLDALIFTGGIGEKAHYIRKSVCNYLEFLKLNLNDKKNIKCAKVISDQKSKIKVFVIPTNEEKAIAIETEKLSLQTK